MLSRLSTLCIACVLSYMSTYTPFWIYLDSLDRHLLFCESLFCCVRPLELYHFESSLEILSVSPPHLLLQIDWCRLKVSIVLVYTMDIAQQFSLSIFYFFFKIHTRVSHLSSFDNFAYLKKRSNERDCCKVRFSWIAIQCRAFYTPYLNFF